MSGAEDGGVGGTPSCPSSSNGDNGRGRGGSAPDDGAKVVGVCPVSSSTTKSTDRRLGGRGGANLHHRRRRSLASHPSSSTVASSGQRRLHAMLLRAAGRWGCAFRGIAPALAPSSPSSASPPPLSLFLCSPLHSLPRLLRNCSGMKRWGGGCTNGIIYGSVGA